MGKSYLKDRKECIVRKMDNIHFMDVFFPEIFD
jgi:hypothetical protein